MNIRHLLSISVPVLTGMLVFPFLHKEQPSQSHGVISDHSLFYFSNDCWRWLA